MAVCTYDNPDTMMRECWQNGKLQAAYAAELYALKEWPIPPHLYHMGANIGDWKTGQIWGDKAAMSSKHKVTRRASARSLLTAGLERCFN